MLQEKRQTSSEMMEAVRYTAERRPDLRCTAPSRQNGRRCRRCVAPGWTVCYIHGAGNRNPEKGKRNQALPPKGERNRANREVKLGRRLGDRIVQAEAKTIPAEVHAEFARNWAGRIKPGDHGRFLLLLNMRMGGSLSARAWKDGLRAVGLLD
jgi:hypothetical protein